MSWTLAPALKKLIDETNAKWPNRSKKSDGTIGDKAHQQRDSEHNPDEKSRVLAADITLTGANRAEFLDSVIGDSRVHYVINEGKIYSRHNNWIAKTYKGDNKHIGYAHVSLRNKVSENATENTVSKAANDTSAWFSDAPASKPKPPTSKPSGSVLKVGSKGSSVTALQKGLNKVFPAYRNAVAPKGKLLVVDSVFGAHTERWVKEFQRRVGIKADGVVGADTKKNLNKYGIKV